MSTARRPKVHIHPSQPKRPGSAAPNRRKAGGWKDYLPLIVILDVTLAVACAKQAVHWTWDSMTWMSDFMGFFLVVFSMLKLFDLSGFADGFQMYDLLAKRFRPWAYVYPFVELFLGLGYLAQWQPKVILAITIPVMLWGAAGVLLALKKGLNVNCACMGTSLKVPLSTVALVESIGMAAMAGAMWFMV